jgi:NhaP-type Na+/H+ or K+/H+ antiporter
LLRFIEAEGQLLNLSVFFIFGVLVAGLIQPLGWEVALYGLLSLTLIHVLPVAASLVGTGLGGASVALMGWVGPRGAEPVADGRLLVLHLYLDPARRRGGRPRVLCVHTLVTRRSTTPCA